jgi:hypothetical protein
MTEEPITNSPDGKIVQNGWIIEAWPAIGGGTISVVIPPDYRRQWPECMPSPDGHRHPFGLPWPQDALSETDRV